jgi:hypothetical protein
MSCSYRSLRVSPIVLREGAGNQVRLSTGVSAEMAGEPPVSEVMVAIDAEVARTGLSLWYARRPEWGLNG